MFTQNLKTIVKQSFKINSGCKEVTTEDLLISLIESKNSLGAKILAEQGVKISRIKSSSVKRNKKIQITAGYKKILLNSTKVAIKYHNKFVGTEHLLYSFLTLQRCKAYKILNKLLKDTGQLKENLLYLIQNHAQKFNRYSKIFDKINQKNIKSKNRKESERKSDQKTVIDLFCVDLVEKARKGKLDPLVGRKKEMERLINILMRRNKNNPLLIGLPGVGKTALVEGLAQKIAQKNLPAYFWDKRILSLDLANLIAGTIFRGEFEARLQKIIEDVEKNKSNIILFIDEVHNIVGAGSAAGSLDTANILKAPLTRGSFQCIGATTLEEYQKYLEKDKALERRFQKVILNEPSPNEALKILQGTKKEYEEFHQIKIPNSVLKYTVKTAHRFINDRFLPDKALDLLDEALANLKNKTAVLDNYTEIKKSEEKIKQIIKEKIKAVEKENFILALKLKKEEKELKEKLKQLNNTLKAKKNKLYPILKIQDIEKTLENTTAIPLHLLRKEKENLLNLEKRLAEKIIGQDKIIQKISKLIRKARVGLASENKPLASILFLGPTGVGKTELAKVLAAEIFGNERNLIRLDMSEFKESFSASRLIGAPAGYVGYEEGSFFTEKIRHQPYSLILLDEIEKAHPEILNLLLQILEEGSLNDHKGHNVSFKNTIIVMTSNLGTERLTQKEKLGFMDAIAKENDQEEIKIKIQESLREFLRPELINRLDKILVFNSLTSSNLEKIAQIELTKLINKLKPKKIKLKVSSSIYPFLARKAKTENLGARPLQRIISNLIEDEIAKLILEKKAKSGKILKVKLNQKKRIIIE